MGVGSSKSVEGEASRETGDGSEERLEGLGEMMGDVVLVDLRETSSDDELAETKYDESRRKERRRRTCIIVVSDCFAFEIEVSPQQAMTFLS